MEKQEAIHSLLGIDMNVVNSADSGKVFEEYKKVEELKKELSKSEETLKEKLKELAENQGVLDEKGSYKVELPDGRWFKKEARTSVEIDKDKIRELDEERKFSFVRPKIELITDREKEDLIDKAINIILEETGITEIVKEYDIFEDGIEYAYQNGEIDDNDLREIIKQSVSYALTKSKG